MELGSPNRAVGAPVFRRAVPRGFARVGSVRSLGFALCLVALVIAAAASLAIWLACDAARDGLGCADRSAREHPGAVRGARVRGPRTLIGLIAGAALGLAGAVMQGLTRNPLAEPGILGDQRRRGAGRGGRGPAVGVPRPSATSGSRSRAPGRRAARVRDRGARARGATPVKLAIAGAAVTALLVSLRRCSCCATCDARPLRFWLVGSLAGRGAEAAAQVWPFVAAGAVMALALRPAAERALARRRRGALARPARRRRARLRGRRGHRAGGRGDRRRRADHVRRADHPARRAHARAAPTTVGSCPTPRSSGRYCCSARTSWGASSPGRRSCRPASSPRWSGRRSSSRWCAGAGSRSSERQRAGHRRRAAAAGAGDSARPAGPSPGPRRAPRPGAARRRRARGRGAARRLRERQRRRLPDPARRRRARRCSASATRRRRSSPASCDCRVCSAACWSGGALGLSGAIFQAVARNPLASPDILGVLQGGAVAAVFGITVLGASAALVSVSAFAGALRDDDRRSTCSPTAAASRATASCSSGSGWPRSAPRWSTGS